jgi:serine/threonine protein kinase
MNLQFREGQVFPKQYVLSKRSASDPDSSSSVESWIATHHQTGDRVLVRFMATGLDDDTWSSVNKRVSTLRGLVHQNISLNVEAGIEDGIQYLVEPYLTDSQILNLDDPGIWPLLQQLLGALIYAHNLGIAHGTLCPGNIMVDASGIVHITGFALPAVTYPANEQAYLSPQVLAGRDPGTDDDIYSLGCILFKALTGKSWKKDVELDLPLDAHLERQLRAMLSESPFERPTTLLELRESIGNHFEGSSTAIESVAFSRRSSSVLETTTTATPDLIDKRQDQAIPLQRVLLAGICLLIFAALLFAFLPTNAPSETIYSANSPAVITTRGPATTSTAAPVVTPLESARLEMFQKQGEEYARDILRLQLDLEDIGVIFWARNDYEKIGADLDAADNLYREKQFQPALDQYKAVSTRLSQLQSRAISELEKHTTLGDEALLAGDAEAALTSFTIATSIDGESEGLQKRLARAETLDQVQDLVRQGEVYERNGEFDRARDTFKTATNLDGEWKPARQGLSRVQSAITLKNFQIAMSEGFREVSNKNYEAAREGFNRAKKILPNSTEPEDGLLQVEQSERNDIILNHQKNAQAHLVSGNWPGAIGEYEAALVIADSLEFAQTGLDYAKSRLALQERLQQFLSDPTLLQSDEGLAEASATLRQASRAKPTTDQMLHHIDILARLISTARIEIPVTINSDGTTEVTVRRHVALGKVTNKVVFLIPGRYTVVGQRLGYRDVREDLVLLAGEPSPILEIASTERVR